jgi:hypothetical protein
MIFSPSGPCITINRLAGCRISSCFDFGDHPNEDVLYLQLENRDLEIQIFQIIFNEFETSLED